MELFGLTGTSLMLGISVAAVLVVAVLGYVYYRLRYSSSGASATPDQVREPLAVGEIDTGVEEEEEEQETAAASAAPSEGAEASE